MPFNHSNSLSNRQLTEEKEAALIVFVIFFGLLIIILICLIFKWINLYTTYEEEENLPIINN